MSFAERSIQLGDYGARFVVTCIDLDGTVIDLTNMSNAYYVFKRPDGTVEADQEVQWANPNDPTDGRLHWDSPIDFFDVAGHWQWQVRVEFGTDMIFRSDIIRFLVKENL